MREEKHFDLRGNNEKKIKENTRIFKLIHYYIKFPITV